MTHMFSRRLFLVAPGLMALATPALAQSPGAQTPPADVVERFHTTLLEVMRNAQNLGARGRYDRLTPVMSQAFDLAAMTRIATGSNWSSLPPDQQAALSQAFTRWSIATYAARFDGYSGETFTTLGTQSLPNGDVLVRTRLNRTDGDPVVLSYLLRGNPPRIVDVYLTGTISELASRRSEFSALIRDGGVPRVMQELETRTARLLAA
jgi:phospholipid transport system substrate-binding protein